MDFDIDKLYVGLHSALKLALAEIEEALFALTELEDVKEVADILIRVLRRHGLAWEGEISPSPVNKEQIR